MKGKKVQFLTTAAVIAALYCALTFVIAPLEFGVFQFRISEVLTVLPLFSPAAIPGLAIGCALSNIIGAMVGINPIGLIDAIFGTSATLFAALCTYAIGKCRLRWPKYLFAPLPPVLFNGLIIGFELAWVSVPMDGAFAAAFLSYAASVAVGELVVCYLLGILLMLVLYHKDSRGKYLYQEIFKN